jgi:hypothetical protein
MDRSRAATRARFNSWTFSEDSVATNCVNRYLNIGVRKSQRTADVLGRPSSGPRRTPRGVARPPAPV